MGDGIEIWLVCSALGLIALGAILLRFERRRIAEETRRNVLASVMDAQNNFLNTMVYFRTRAETQGALSPADLLAMERTIRETQAQMAAIEQADLHQTRDLGGIHVLRTPKPTLAR